MSCNTMSEYYYDATQVSRVMPAHPPCICVIMVKAAWIPDNPGYPHSHKVSCFALKLTVTRFPREIKVDGMRIVTHLQLQL